MPAPTNLLDRLKNAQERLHQAMDELIANKNNAEAERLLHIADKLLHGLIKDAGGYVAPDE